MTHDTTVTFPRKAGQFAGRKAGTSLAPLFARINLHHQGHILNRQPPSSKLCVQSGAVLSQSLLYIYLSISTSAALRFSTNQHHAEAPSVVFQQRHCFSMRTSFGEGGETQQLRPERSSRRTPSSFKLTAQQGGVLGIKEYAVRANARHHLMPTLLKLHPFQCFCLAGSRAVGSHAAQPPCIMRGPLCPFLRFPFSPHVHGPHVQCTCRLRML
jgi:hypothetical protein